MANPTPPVSTNTPPVVERELLRRADWRFLLPSAPGGAYKHLVLLGGPAGLAERIVEAGIAEQVSCDVPPTASADVLAILHDSSVDVQAALKCLVPGGALYYEVSRRSRRSFTATPARLVQSLRNAGVTPCGVFAVRPHFDACEMYLPLNVPRALEWYVTTLYTAGTHVQRILEQGLRVFTGLKSHAFALLAPYYAVTATMGTQAGAAPSFLGHPGLPDRLKHERLFPLMLTDGGNRVALLPFAANGTQPLAVLKVPKLPSFNDRTKNEQQALHEVRSRLSSAMQQTIPEPLGMLQHGDITSSVETYLPGRSLVSSSGRWRIPVHRKVKDVEIAAGWLTEFHRQTELERVPWDVAAIEQWVEEPFAAYRRLYGTIPGEEQLFQATRAYAASLTDVLLPIVWVHRDFNVWNIFRDGDQPTVIDWEGGRHGPALCDLLHFVTHWNDTVRHLSSMPDRVAGFRTLFFQYDQADALAQAVHRAIRQYMQHINMDPRLRPIILVYTWMELALRRADQLRDMGEIVPHERSSNRYVGYIDVLAHHVPQLFFHDADE